MGFVTRAWARHMRLFLIAAATCWVIWIAAQFLRDINPGIAVIFYVPAPFMAASLLAAASAAWLGKRKSFALTFLLLAAAPAGCVLFVENRWTPPERPAAAVGETLRLVHWNVCWGTGGWKAIKEKLDEQNADIYVLSEIPERTDTYYIADFAGPCHAVRRLGDMVVIASGSLVSENWLVRNRELALCLLEWRHEGETVRLFVADISSSIVRGRGPYLEEIVRQMEAHGPDLVVGDFNAPRRSRALCPLPEGYIHAYEAAGCGWSYTWPFPCPMLAIDQCICGSRIDPVSYDLRSSFRSDHRMQVLDFALR
jgi:hypothetical protein